MKKHLFFFVCLLFFITQTKAQTSVYYQFPDSNAFWNETVYGYNDTCDKNEYYSVFINGDTMIGGHLYNKLLESGYSYSSICDTAYTYSDNIYTAAIRQDTSLKEVFIVPKSASSEMLLYDFNLALGDTLPASYEGAGNFNYVLSVDSILIGNKYRKSFAVGLLDSTYSYFSLIEGVGSSFGLIAPLSPPNKYTYSLNCFSQNGKTLYPDSTYSCSLISGIAGINEWVSKDTIYIYPNPAGNELRIKNPVINGTSSELRMEKTTIYIVNMLGQTIYQTQILNPQSQIDISRLPSGIYILQLTTENQWWTGRFVKE